MKVQHSKDTDTMMQHMLARVLFCLMQGQSGMVSNTFNRKYKGYKTYPGDFEEVVSLITCITSPRIHPDIKAPTYPCGIYNHYSRPGGMYESRGTTIKDGQLFLLHGCAAGSVERMWLDGCTTPLQCVHYNMSWGCAVAGFAFVQPSSSHIDRKTLANTRENSTLLVIRTVQTPLYLQGVCD